MPRSSAEVYAGKKSSERMLSSPTPCSFGTAPPCTEGRGGEGMQVGWKLGIQPGTSIEFVCPAVG